MYGKFNPTISNPPIYNVNTSHPLIQNSQEYLYYKKYISIHSQDRDMLKYPNASEFEIELPEDYLNVSSMRLIQWTFPSNYNTFSISNSNIYLSFKITQPYNPAEFGVSDEYNFRIFQALFESNREYNISIEEGFYTPYQMITELTNKFNHAITERIEQFFNMKNNEEPNERWDIILSQFKLNGGYNRFIIVYNEVTLKLWFGNRADSFEVVNELSVIDAVYSENYCQITARGQVPEFSNYGLPANLGLRRCNQFSVSSFATPINPNYAKLNDIEIPRFYYGDVVPGDNGYWLLPLELEGCRAHWIEATEKLNIMGEAFLYMEIAKHNCIDETQPYNVSSFTVETNKTNGIVNAAFAKMPVPATPLSQWFDRESIPYKFYYPPAERIRKLTIKIRYHNGQLANFGVFNYSFMLEFTLMLPQMLRSDTSVPASSLFGR
jgi:hypothetical protein